MKICWLSLGAGWLMASIFWAGIWQMCNAANAFHDNPANKGRSIKDQPVLYSNPHKACVDCNDYDGCGEIFTCEKKEGL